MLSFLDYKQRIQTQRPSSAECQLWEPLNTHAHWCHCYPGLPTGSTVIPQCAGRKSARQDLCTATTPTLFEKRESRVHDTSYNVLAVLKTSSHWFYFDLHFALPSWLVVPSAAYLLFYTSSVWRSQCIVKQQLLLQCYSYNRPMETHLRDDTVLPVLSCYLNRRNYQGRCYITTTQPGMVTNDSLCSNYFCNVFIFIATMTVAI